MTLQQRAWQSRDTQVLITGLFCFTKAIKCSASQWRLPQADLGEDHPLTEGSHTTEDYTRDPWTPSGCHGRLRLGVAGDRERRNSVDLRGNKRQICKILCSSALQQSAIWPCITIRISTNPSSWYSDVLIITHSQRCGGAERRVIETKISTEGGYLCLSSPGSCCAGWCQLCHSCDLWHEASSSSRQWWWRLAQTHACCVFKVLAETEAAYQHATSVTGPVYLEECRLEPDERLQSWCNLVGECSNMGGVTR